MSIEDDHHDSTSDELSELDENEDWGNPNTQARDGAATGQGSLKRKAFISSILLFFCLLSYTTQTESTIYIQNDLGWKKAYCMLYFVHSSMSIIWPIQLVVLRIRQWNVPWSVFWARHCELMRTTAQMIQHQSTELSLSQKRTSPIPYVVRTVIIITICMTMGAITWFIAVHLTTASDVTAIYNCAAFFAYAFSIPLLKEKPDLGKNCSVVLAIIGILTVAYGDSVLSGEAFSKDKEQSVQATNRALGNVIIGVGSILTGLFDVIYKKMACPPDHASHERSIIFANSFGGMMGAFTFLFLWMPLPLLHFTGIEPFELPSREAAFWIFISALSAATFTGSFLALISLTSPVLSAVASLLTIFIIALVDWIFKGEGLSHATLLGGVLITAAFLLLSWATLKEEYNSPYQSLEMHTY